VDGKALTTLLLSPVEIVDHRVKGLCFHCHDKFTHGHPKECKHLFVIEVICDEYEMMPEEAITVPTISLHAITGIQPRSGHTMQVPSGHGERCNVDGTARLGLNTQLNFIDTESAQRAGVQLHDDTGLRVAIANGDRLSCTSRCPDLAIWIGTEPFNINCYGLSLGSYKMVLSIQWLESLEPILWDFASCTMAFWDGHYDVWSATSTSPTPPTLLAAPSM
jgi:hypothetical protein